MGDKRDNAKRLKAKIEGCEKRLYQDDLIVNPLTGEVHGIKTRCLTNALADLQAKEFLTIKDQKTLSGIRAQIDFEEAMLKIWNDPVKGPRALLEEADEKVLKAKKESNSINAEIEIKSGCPIRVDRVLRNLLRDSTGEQYATENVSLADDGETMLYKGVDALELVGWDLKRSPRKPFKVIKVSTEDRVAS